MIAAYNYTESPTMSEDAPGHSGVGKTQQRQPWQGANAPRSRSGIRLAETEDTPAPSVYIRVRRRTELILRVKGTQEIGEQIIASAIDRGLQVLASCSLSHNVWLLVVENEELARKVLDATTIEFRIESVLLVEAAPRIAAITQLDQSLRRSNVDVIYSYAVPAEGDQLIAVFKTQDDDRVMRALLAGVGDEGSARRDYKRESVKDVPMILQKQTGV
jgi:hypothetical protein